MIFFEEKEAPVIPYTLSRCDSCGHDSKRKFAPDDYLYKESECGKCGKAEVILGIFGEAEGSASS